MNDQPTADRPIDQRTRWGLESRSTRLSRKFDRMTGWQSDRVADWQRDSVTFITLVYPPVFHLSCFLSKFGSCRWQMKKDEWRMTNDKWRMMNEQGWMMNDEWQKNKDEWWMMNDEWRMTNEQWGFLLRFRWQIPIAFLVPHPSLFYRGMVFVPDQFSMIIFTPCPETDVEQATSFVSVVSFCIGPDLHRQAKKSGKA